MRNVIVLVVESREPLVVAVVALALDLDQLAIVVSRTVD